MPDVSEPLIDTKRQLPDGVTTDFLDQVQTRAIAASVLADIAQQFRESGVELKALLGGEVVDLLDGRRDDQATLKQAPSPDAVASQDDIEPTAVPVPGVTISQIKETGVTAHAAYVDGTTVMKSVVSSNTQWRTIVKRRSADGNTKTTTVIGDGEHMAIITDSLAAGSPRSTSHAQGDMNIIYNEFDRRLHEDS